MNTQNRASAQTVYAQNLTEELVARAGISPGMRAVVFGEDIADLAFLVAERVGPSGSVLGVHEDARTIAQAARRASELCFGQIQFHAQLPNAIALDAPADAIIGRFFLMHQPDPVEAIRQAAALVRPGGRVIFHEWHLESILWQHLSSWPKLPLYHAFARAAVRALRVGELHVDMGLRLPNAFVEAGLPLPVFQTDLRSVSGKCALGYAFFEEVLRRMLPLLERAETDSGNLTDRAFAARLEREVIASGGHAFLPLQVGVWTRK